MPTDPIETHVAHASTRSHRLFGYDLFSEVAGVASLWDLIALCVRGPALSATDRAVLDDLIGCCTVADPRLPPLKLVRLAAAHGSVLAGCAAGLLALEDAFIGPWSAGAAARWLRDVEPALRDAPDPAAEALRAVDQALARDGVLPGFGVPFRDRDERVAALDACLRRRGRAGRRYWRALRAVEAAAVARKGIGANIGAGVAACLLDLGFSPREIPTVSALLALPCILANAYESASQRAPAMQAVDPSAVEYVGPPHRTSPRAAAAASPAGSTTEESP